MLPDCCKQLNDCCLTFQDCCPFAPYVGYIILGFFTLIFFLLWRRAACKARCCAAVNAVMQKCCCPTNPKTGCDYTQQQVIDTITSVNAEAQETIRKVSEDAFNKLAGAHSSSLNTITNIVNDFTSEEDDDKD